MSKINAIRLVNLNYNHNTMKVSDETFSLSGKDTLLALRNGGGKSVIIQMVSSIFVHKRYRNLKDRKFSSYFKTSEPTFIMVEWILDGGMQKVLTGSMIRKNNRAGEDGEDDLEIINFVSENSEPSETDINNLPVTTKGKKTFTLKSFVNMRTLFEGYRKNKKLNFFMYDMNNSSQSRSYFKKIREYQIYSEEWEEIHRKINLKESGLSELFLDCKDTRKLVETWFFPTIEKKLNKESDRMKNFRTIFSKYVIQHDKNQDKLSKKDKINLFKEKTNSLLNEACIYRENSEEAERRLNEISMYKTALKDILQKKKEIKKEKEKEKIDLESLLIRIDYEEKSLFSHRIKKELNKISMTLALINEEITGLQNEIDRTHKDKNIILAAKCYEEYKNEEIELKEIEEKINISSKKDEELKPERENIGGRLKYFYQEKTKSLEEEILNKKNLLEKDNLDLEREEEEKRKLEKKKEECIRSQGEVKGEINSFTKDEVNFNKKYNERFQRNIFGKYEDGFIAKKEEEYKSEEKNARKDFEKAVAMEEEKKNSIRDNGREIETLLGKKDELEKEKEDLIRSLDLYRKEIANREKVAAYLDYKGDLYNKEIILESLERKIKKILAIKRELEKERSEEKNEINKLKTGKIMEIPEEMREAFDAEGIPVYTGFEWIKKNEYTKKENREIVKRNPFIPYSLIVSEKAIERLKKKSLKVYTSFPIPIVSRESLNANGEEIKSSIINLDKIYFYCLFNEDLIDEKALKNVIKKREDNLLRVEKEITQREIESEKFYGDKLTINNQNVSRYKKKEKEKRLEEVKNMLIDINKNIKDLKNDISNLEKEVRREEEKKTISQGMINKVEGKISDFYGISLSYKLYIENMEKKESFLRRERILDDKHRLSREIIKELNEKINEEEFKAQELRITKDDLTSALYIYNSYREVKTSISCEEAREIEARYKAITTMLSEEVKNLEILKEKQVKRYNDKFGEYKYLLEQYNLKEELVKNSKYTREKSERLNKHLKEKEEKKNKKNHEKNEIEKRQAVKIAEEERILKEIKKKFAKENLIPLEEIKDDKFEDRKVKVNNKLTHINIEAKENDEKIASVSENISALSEYEDFEGIISDELTTEILNYSSEEIRRKQGILRRQYREKEKEVERNKERIRENLYNLRSSKEFQEEMFKKPILVILEVLDSPKNMLRQIMTTRDAFDTSMKKLMIDLKVLDDERMLLMEQLEEYLYEVNSELEQIDDDTSITFNERSEKMLKVELPTWIENEEIYKARLSDFIFDTTRRALLVIEKNENLEEFFSSNLQTRTLYDAVCITESVKVYLRKVETDRNYLIPWSEVSKNSGAENFLASFIVITSLMTYLRKDNMDVFAAKKKSKILFMDNPFGQTSAKHILEPLMAMARKTQTQIIALSGLGDEAIYNCFDNIYVLSIISSKLRDVSYLKGEHLRGSEMVPTHIEVFEQQTLF